MEAFIKAVLWAVGIYLVLYLALVGAGVALQLTWNLFILGLLILIVTGILKFLERR